MTSIAICPVRSAARAVAIAAAFTSVTSAGCQRLASRGSAGDPQSPPEPPAEAREPSALQPGPVTPKTQAPGEARVLSSAFSAAARALGPSVVRIDVEIPSAGVAENQGQGDPGEGPELSPFLRRFFQFGSGMPEPSPGPQVGTGSGVVMDGRGDIVTNRHVVSNATKVKVTFSDGREFAARTLGMDSETDVAVIRLEKSPRDLVAARLGDSDALEVGEWVLAIGSPLGLDQTVTAGIVSGKGKVGRYVQMSGGRVRHYIQTDAKINPGNSGGPLVNLSAEVVGINALINTGPGGAYGFAIPINQVRLVAESLLKDGRVHYPYLGVVVGDVGEAEAANLKKRVGAAPPEGGAYVSEVTPGGPAAKSGLHPGDVITDIDERKVDGAGDVIDYVSTRAIGARVAIGFWRDGRRRTIAVGLGELPSEDGYPGAPSTKLGIALQTLTPALARSMGLDPATRAAVVAEVAPGSQAAAAGVREGDLILEIDRQPVATAEAAAALLAAPRQGGHLVRLRSESGMRFITLGDE
jgi:serine protease Do